MPDLQARIGLVAPAHAGDKGEHTNMSTDKATPRPWNMQPLSDNYTHIVRGPENVLVVQCAQTPKGKANAELIVRAVNSHEVLLAACQEAFYFMEENGFFDLTDDTYGPTATRLLAAIAAAEKGTSNG